MVSITCFNDNDFGIDDDKAIFIGVHSFSNLLLYVSNL